MYVCFKMLTIPPELAECNHFPKALDRHAFQVHTPQLPLTAQRFSSVFPFCFNVAIQLYIRASTFAVRPPSEQYATSFKKKDYRMPQLCDTRPFLVVGLERAASETFPAQSVQKAKRVFRIIL